ncbi:MAG: hypothetical protein PHT33_05995 [bacterium]|nr:hypothetical protein [bacterium]
MIAQLHHCVEQLDLAAEQLQRRLPAFARFALILTDNVMELVLHRHARQVMKRSALWGLSTLPKYSEKEKARVLGQRFDEKVKFAKKDKVILPDEAAFILICHSYRNQLYHQGLIHEGIIVDIAWHYHELVCSVIPRLKHEDYWWSSTDRLSDIVKEYCGEKGLSHNLQSALPVVARKLSEAKPPIDRHFGVALGDAVIARLDDLDRMIDFISNNAPQKRTREEAIFEAQMWPVLLSSDSAGSVINASGGTVNTMGDAIKVFKRHWNSPIISDPIQKWRCRAESLRTETCILRALQKYQKLVDDMVVLEEQVGDSAVSLDQYIQGQNDHMLDQ